MDRPSFYDLVENLTPYLQQRKRTRSDLIGPPERVCLALMWLGGGGACLESLRPRCYYDVYSVQMVYEAICDVLANEVRLPDQ